MFVSWTEFSLSSGHSAIKEKSAREYQDLPYSCAMSRTRWAIAGVALVVGAPLAMVILGAWWVKGVGCIWIGIDVWALMQFLEDRERSRAQPRPAISISNPPQFKDGALRMLRLLKGTSGMGRLALVSVVEGTDSDHKPRLTQYLVTEHGQEKQVLQKVKNAFPDGRARIDTSGLIATKLRKDMVEAREEEKLRKELEREAAKQ